MTGVGRTPRRPVVAEDIRDLQLRTEHCGGGYAGGCSGWSSRCSFAGLWLRLFALLAWLRQRVEWTLNLGDHAGGDAGIARRCIELLVPQQRLDDSDIDAALKKMGREAVPQRMHGVRSS